MSLSAAIAEYVMEHPDKSVPGDFSFEGSIDGSSLYIRALIDQDAKEWLEITIASADGFAFFRGPYNRGTPDRCSRGIVRQDDDIANHYWNAPNTRVQEAYELTLRSLYDLLIETDE